MSNDIKHRLRKAQKSVTTWLGANNSTGGGGGSGSGPSSNDPSLIGKRISTPQLIKRTLHVAYDTETGNFTGVPTQWQSEFDKAASLADSQLKIIPKDLPLSGTEDLDPKATTMQSSTRSRNRVWYDQCNRKFVNLPTHWRDRLVRNNLSDWSEFQRNPDLLTTVFTLMDEELKLMDLTSLGLDSTFYSSVPAATIPTADRENANGRVVDAPAATIPTADRENANGRVVDAPAASAHQHQQLQSTNQQKESVEHHPDGSASRAVNGWSRNSTNTRAATIVWTQQRSFGRDDDSDGEEFAEL